MKNLIKAIEQEKKKQLEDFKSQVNLEKLNTDSFKYSWYGNLIPRGKDLSKMSETELKAYLITRKEKSTYKAIEQEITEINALKEVGKLIDIKIQVEWKASKMWRANPTAECWYSYQKDGDRYSGYVKSRSVGGCGYDKLSTAVAEVLNQIPEVLKPLYLKKDKNMDQHNRLIFGYGSGYGILPQFESGVGVSCFPNIFKAIGFDFKHTASGKTFDVFHCEKLRKADAA